MRTTTIAVLFTLAGCGDLVFEVATQDGGVSGSVSDNSCGATCGSNGSSGSAGDQGGTSSGMAQAGGTSSSGTVAQGGTSSSGTGQVGGTSSSGTGQAGGTSSSGTGQAGGTSSSGTIAQGGTSSSGGVVQGGTSSSGSGGVTSGSSSGAGTVCASPPSFIGAWTGTTSVVTSLGGGAGGGSGGPDAETVVAYGSGIELQAFFSAELSRCVLPFAVTSGTDAALAAPAPCNANNASGGSGDLWTFQSGSATLDPTGCTLTVQTAGTISYAAGGGTNFTTTSSLELQ